MLRSDIIYVNRAVITQELQMLPEIWFTICLIYAVFIFWYYNWKGPLTRSEIDRYTLLLKQQISDPEIYNAIVHFMHKDDGKGFVMLNMIVFQKGLINHPVTSEPLKSQALLLEYFKPFSSQILRRAGHPVLQATLRAGYIEAWGVEPNPGWQLFGLIRYRSRRDMLELITADAFHAVHDYKKAAILKTLAMPMQIRSSLFASPPVWGAMLLFILGQIITILNLMP